MAEVTCPGLPASWLNAWLAAVGATVLDPRIRLRWTTEKTPTAVLCAEDVDPVAALAASWPDEEVLADMAIAERWHDTPRLPRRVSVDAFVARARATRGHPHSWTLSSTMTDLCLNENREVTHARFDPGVPRGYVMHHRLVQVHNLVDPAPTRLMDSLIGRATRAESNGLGFDLTRMGSQSDASGMAVDPVVEVLAFFGLALLPVRGAGTDRSVRGSSHSIAVQRGWRRMPGNRRERFMWPSWEPPLDRAAIDALLDIWEPDKKTVWPRVGIHAAWQSVEFQGRSDRDPTRGFGAERL